MRMLGLTMVLGTFALACSSSSGAGESAGAAGSGAGGDGGAAGAAGAGGVADAASTGPCGDVTLDQDLTVAAGETVSICAGSTLHAAAGISIVVEGTLVVGGAAGSPVKLVGQVAGPGSWAGLVLHGGGSLQLSYAEITDATLALDAQAGSTFAADHLTVSGSSQMLHLASGGTLSHGELHGLGASQGDGPVVVENASPTVSDTLIDGANGGVDIVTAFGASSAATFDHMEVTQAHCAFHFNQGSGMSITNSYIHDVVSGLMVIGSTTTIDGDDFEHNQVNVSTCTSGSVTVTGSYYTGNLFDSSCKGQPASPSLGAKPTGAGPRP